MNNLDRDNDGGGRNILSGDREFAEVAVLLAAFNGKRWLREQLESILSQENVNVTVFISVDRSSDGTEAWVKEYSKIDRRVVLLPDGGRYGGAAANFFRLIKDVDLSEFDYVSLADQDDLWYIDKLSRAIKKIREGSDCYSSNVGAFWEGGRQVLIDKAQPQCQWDFLFEGAGPGCTFVLKVEVVQAIQSMIKKKLELIQRIGFHDWFIYAFARANGYKWIIDSNPSMRYRQHEENVVGANSGFGAFIRRIRKVANGWALEQAILIAHLVGLGNDNFVRRWINGSRFGLAWLCFHASQCRRNPRERPFFAMSCILMAVIGLGRKRNSLG